MLIPGGLFCKILFSGGSLFEWGAFSEVGGYSGIYGTSLEMKNNDCNFAFIYLLRFALVRTDIAVCFPNFFELCHLHQIAHYLLFTLHSIIRL